MCEIHLCDDDLSFVHCLSNPKLQLTGDRWQLANIRWQVTGGNLKVALGRWRLAGLKMAGFSLTSFESIGRNVRLCVCVS